MRHALIGLLFLSCLPVWADGETSRLETIVVDKTTQVIFSHLPRDCYAAKISFLRQDPLKPGYVAVTRAARLDEKMGQIISLELGPEFWPYAYQVASIQMTCYDENSEATVKLGNPEPLDLQTALREINVSKDMRPFDETHF